MRALICGKDQSRRAGGSIGEEEISAKRSSHGAAAMDASEEYGLARPRKDKAAIFNTRARIIIFIPVYV